MLAPAKDWGQPLRCSGACWGDVKDLGAGRRGAPAGGVLLQASLRLEREVPGPDAYLGTKVASGRHRREPVLSHPLRVPWWKGHSSGEPCPLILWVPGVRAVGCDPTVYSLRDWGAGSLSSLTLTFGASSTGLPLPAPHLRWSRSPPAPRPTLPSPPWAWPLPGTWPRPVPPAVLGGTLGSFSVRRDVWLLSWSVSGAFCHSFPIMLL